MNQTLRIACIALITLGAAAPALAQYDTGTGSGPTGNDSGNRRPLRYSCYASDRSVTIQNGVATVDDDKPGRAGYVVEARAIHSVATILTQSTSIDITNQSEEFTSFVLNGRVHRVYNAMATGTYRVPWSNRDYPVTLRLFIDEGKAEADDDGGTTVGQDPPSTGDDELEAGQTDFFEAVCQSSGRAKYKLHQYEGVRHMPSVGVPYLFERHTYDYGQFSSPATATKPALDPGLFAGGDATYQPRDMSNYWAVFAQEVE